jgi:hypothetical protein
VKATGITFLLIVFLAGMAFAKGPEGQPRLAPFHPGLGVSHPLMMEDRKVLWSDPPDLWGLIGSSEQILQYGLETEIANDFVLSNGLVTRVTFWGGYWNNSVACDPGIPTPGFNFEFFEDAGGRPGNLIASFAVTDYHERFVDCQQGYYPIYEYSVPVELRFVPGVRYWFCAQYRDHSFPPQAGRLAARYIQGYDSVFRSVYFGYPDWTPADDTGIPFDASQEFSGPETDAGGACCLDHGLCRIMSELDCRDQDGVWQGTGIPCDPLTCAGAACCASDGSCTMTTRAECASGSEWQGIGTDCLSATCAPRAPGSIVAWGGDGGVHDVPAPNTGFRAVSTRASHGLALRRDGTLVAWGDNSHGQCNVPQGLRDPIEFAAGGRHSLAIRPDGSIIGWGHNYNHQCDPPAPDTGFVAVDAGDSHSLGLTSDGRVLAWGNNVYHQCEVPDSGPDFIAIAAGGWHNLALRRDGSIMAWGDNYAGDCDVPAPNTGFVAVAGGASHSLGLKSDGSIVAWGYDDDGQCDVPEPNANFTAIAAGRTHSLGLKADGSIVVWGSNEGGECNFPGPNGGFTAIAASFWFGSFAVSRDVTVAPPVQSPPALAALSSLTAATSHAKGGQSMAAALEADAIDSSVRITPNPSHGPVLLDFEIAQTAPSVDLDIYDATGRVVRRLSLGSRPAGRHSIEWDGRDEGGRPLPTGVYLVRMLVDGTVRSGRVVVIGR